MPILTDIFAARDAHLPAPRWVCGDRVYGRLGKIPVIGTVIREDYNDRSLVLVHLDLPVKIQDEYRWIVFIPSKRIQRLKVIE